ncbi:hypothetical protein ACHAWF_003588 [Thalassiosira exigua]
MQVICYEDDVATMASRLQGGAGPCGVKANVLGSWLARWKEHSACLRVEMGEWVELLANSASRHVMYRAANAGQMIPADKEPGSRNDPNTGFGIVLGDADNGFNRINWYILDAVDCIFSRFAFNRYRHHNIVIVQDKAGLPPIVLYNEEGVTQGCCFGMFLYGIVMIPLSEGALDHAEKEALQTWFADTTWGRRVGGVEC